MKTYNDYEIFSVYEISHLVMAWNVGVEMEYVCSYPNNLKLPQDRLVGDLLNIGDYADYVAFLIVGEHAIRQWYGKRKNPKISLPLQACIAAENKKLQQF
ncbi:hypothetical protein [Paraglaciecola hydrolytica]|uniref:Uncharacterized protein n=1 Tax=Paraglaciecola hydrolytica TaxID=1799789 RepID=A0A148KKK5_9ALTE|nr:hypothetical protein [Paraglaciecola hydrolytica]KXI26788.1 hypothetical protein AX660_03190 [Paraglaciecola hydrolytica]